jgi:para-nitrobenzyl esterase
VNGAAARRAGLALAVIATTAACASRGKAPAGNDAPPLKGTSWQLVRFQGGDDAVLTPDDGSKYTIAFGPDGMVQVRLDCNRGRGPWRSPGPKQIELGTLAVTRAFCGPPSLHDQILKQWGNIRSYVVKDGHLFLALMADGGIYEFEPTLGSP